MRFYKINEDNIVDINKAKTIKSFSKKENIGIFKLSIDILLVIDIVTGTTKTQDTLSIIITNSPLYSLLHAISGLPIYWYVGNKLEPWK